MFITTTKKKIVRGGRVRGMLSSKILKKWCILKRILIKYQGINSLKIKSLVGEDGGILPWSLETWKV